MGGDTAGWEGHATGWLVGSDGHCDSMGWPRCIKSPENWFGPAGCTVHTRTVLFPACLWNLLLFYQNFLNATPTLMQVIFVLMNGKKACRRKGLLPQRGLQEVARNPGLELETHDRSQVLSSAQRDQVPDGTGPRSWCTGSVGTGPGAHLPSSGEAASSAQCFPAAFCH